MTTTPRTLRDALRDSQQHLPDPLREQLARLYAQEETLSALTERLLTLSQQGVPAERLLPHFYAECTPPLAEAFAPFAGAVAKWHDRPDAPETAALLAEAIVSAGVKNLLIVLGQRLTPASVTDAGALPPARATLLASAMKPHSPADHLSVAARALAKHAPRSSEVEFWGAVTGSSAQKNAAAERLLSHILDNATWWNVFGHYKHELVFEARVPTGHGARWGHSGEEFIGFLEPFLDEEEEEEEPLSS